jgi:hypothetical protein
MCFALLHKKCDNDSSSCYYSETLICVCCAAVSLGTLSLPVRHQVHYIVYVTFFIISLWF